MNFIFTTIKWHKSQKKSEIFVFLMTKEKKKKKKKRENWWESDEWINHACRACIQWKAPSLYFCARCDWQFYLIWCDNDEHRRCGEKRSWKFHLYITHPPPPNQSNLLHFWFERRIERETRDDNRTKIQFSTETISIYA